MEKVQFKDLEKYFKCDEFVKELETTFQDVDYFVEMLADNNINLLNNREIDKTELKKLGFVGKYTLEYDVYYVFSYDGRKLCLILGDDRLFDVPEYEEDCFTIKDNDKFEYKLIEFEQCKIVPPSYYGIDYSNFTNETYKTFDEFEENDFKQIKNLNEYDLSNDNIEVGLAIQWTNELDLYVIISEGIYYLIVENNQIISCIYDEHYVLQLGDCETDVYRNEQTIVVFNRGDVESLVIITRKY